MPAALDGADALAIVTEWKEFRSADMDTIKQKLKNPLIFDGRNLYDPSLMADLVPLMLRAQELGAPADWLVRAKHNRCLPDGDRLWEHTGAGAPIGELTFAMAARHGVKARTVRQQLWARSVTLPAGKGKSVVATCVIAREIDAPDVFQALLGAEGVEAVALP